VPNFADGELAWTSFDMNAKQFDYRYYGNLEGKTSASDKFHPTQKPIALYDWIFHNYAKPTDKILDTHLGSGSSRIAAYKHGLDFTGFELDKDYFEASEKRFNNFKSQLTLF
jgi:site-specific DNA-methyltransferase (adenine-specific)